MRKLFLEIFCILLYQNAYTIYLYTFYIYIYWVFYATVAVHLSCFLTVFCKCFSLIFNYTYTHIVACTTCILLILYSCTIFLNNYFLNICSNLLYFILISNLMLNLLCYCYEKKTNSIEIVSTLTTLSVPYIYFAIWSFVLFFSAYDLFAIMKCVIWLYSIYYTLLYSYSIVFIYINIYISINVNEL